MYSPVVRGGPRAETPVTTLYFEGCFEVSFTGHGLDIRGFRPSGKTPIRLRAGIGEITKNMCGAGPK